MIDIAIVEDDVKEQQRLLRHLKRFAKENQQSLQFSMYTNAFDFLEEKKGI